LNQQGSDALHPLMRERSGGCESADSSEIARAAEGMALAFWFRLVRLRRYVASRTSAFKMCSNIKNIRDGALAMIELATF
jgi:hypothetical protein